MAQGDDAGTRTEALTARFQEINDGLVAALEGCTEEAWARPTSAEGWTVAAVAHHVAEVQGAFVHMVRTLADGATFSPGSSIDDVHESNARHAREHAAAGKPETLTLLKDNRAAIVELLHRLTDADLDRPAGIFGGHPLTVEQVVEYVVIGHAREHLESVRATLPA